LDSAEEIVPALRNKIILKDGSNPTKNSHSLDLINTALRISARFGFLKLAKLELDMGAKPNMRSGPDGGTPLHSAAKYGHLEVVKLLLKRGADPSVASGSGETPLIYAMINGHFDILDVLVTSSSDKLQRGYFQSPASLGVDGDINSQTEFQELSLTALIYPSCTVCDELQIDWQLSAVPGIKDERADSLINDEEKLLPPIIVSGESLMRSELDISFNLRRTGTQHSPSTTVRWFPGAQMYRALGIVAKRGMEDIRRLLIAAGNDPFIIDRVVSVSQLVSQLRVS